MIAFTFNKRKAEDLMEREVGAQWDNPIVLGWVVTDRNSDCCPVAGWQQMNVVNHIGRTDVSPIAK